MLPFQLNFLKQHCFEIIFTI